MQKFYRLLLLISETKLRSKLFLMLSLIILIIITLAFSSGARAENVVEEKLGDNKEVIAAKITPLIQEVKSKYGIKALLVEKKDAPLIHLSLVFKNSGYIYDPENKQGLANLVTLILREGPKDKSIIDFARKLATTGTEIEYNIDQTGFYIDIKALPTSLKGAVELLWQVLFAAKLDEDALNNAKKLQHFHREQELAELEYLAQTEFFKAAFNNTPYANSKYGELSTINNIKLADIKSYFCNTFNRIKLNISVVGAISEKDLAALLDEYIIELPLAIAGMKKIEAVTIKNFATYAVSKKILSRNVILFGQNGLQLYDKNFAKWVVFNCILGGANLNSLLMQAIREKEGLTYSIRTHIHNSDNLNFLLGGATVAPGAAAAVIIKIRKIFEDFSKTGASDAELQTAKKYLRNSFVLRQDESQNILEELIYIQTHNLALNYFEEYFKEIKAITLEDFNLFVKSFLSNPRNKLLFVNIGEISEKL